jgi:hypothetical protein
MASNGNVSHAAIWDDSLLVNSWNEALEEYKVRAAVALSANANLE